MSRPYHGVSLHTRIRITGERVSGICESDSRTLAEQSVPREVYLFSRTGGHIQGGFRNADLRSGTNYWTCLRSRNVHKSLGFVRSRVLDISR